MRRNLNIMAMAITSMVVLAFVVPLGLVIRAQTEDRVLSVAQRDAQAVAAALAVAAGSEPTESLDGLAGLVLQTFPTATNTTIFLPDGEVVGFAAPVTDNVGRARQGLSFSSHVDGGIEVFVPLLLSSGRRAVVRSFVSTAELQGDVGRVWLMLGLLAVALIVSATFVADRMGRSIVGPVLNVATATRSFADGQRQVRVPRDGPSEVVAVADAFNDLAGELDSLLKREREDVADLSHRLRTPLMSLRLQVEALPETVSSHALLAEVDALDAAITTLIDDAREVARPETAAADLVYVARHRAAFWAVLAREQSRQVIVEVPNAELHVDASAKEVGALVDTLIQNIFSHTEPGTDFYISVADEIDEAVLVVADDGPGFPDSSVMRRGASTAGSSGLGLDIVVRIAEAARGTVRLGNLAAGGARIEVRFPCVERVLMPTGGADRSAG